jgi:hypothetical protein
LPKSYVSIGVYVQEYWGHLICNVTMGEGTNQTHMGHAPMRWQAMQRDPQLVPLTRDGSKSP